MGALRKPRRAAVPQPVTEYSLYHPQLRRWVTVGHDGGVRFDSPDPVPLSRFFPSAEAGGEEFAQRMLAWLQSPTTRRAGKWDAAPQEAAGAYVFVFEREGEGTPPEATQPAPDAVVDLSFRPLRRNNGPWISFEVRGAPEAVAEWCRTYEAWFPIDVFTTRFLGQPSQPAEKVMNVFRLRMQGEVSTSPPPWEEPQGFVRPVRHD